MDWQKTAAPGETEEDNEEEEVVEKPKPVKVAVSEVLKRARKPHLKKTALTSKRVNKKGRVFLYNFLSIINETYIYSSMIRIV